MIENMAFNQHLILPERYPIRSLDGGADTFVLGKGWHVYCKSRRARIIGFDNEEVERSLSTVSSITAFNLPNGPSILLAACESFILIEIPIMAIWRRFNLPKTWSNLVYGDREMIQS
jgi:hypothetical protein